MWNITTDHLSIAISGLSGCGNTTVSKKLAKTLGITFINYTFRNLAEAHNLDFDELRKLAETDEKWDLMVDQKQAELSKIGNNVIGSRLAIWMVSNAKIKIYLEASEEVRISRIYKREGGSIEEITQYTQDRDRADHLRYQRLYHIDIKKYRLLADLVINVDEKNPEQIVAVILDALESKNLLSRHNQG